jgi:putative membrane protein
MRVLTIIFCSVLVVFGISFAGLNSSEVVVNYYFNSQALPLSLLLVMTLTFGACLGLLVGLCIYIKLKGQIIRLQRRIKLIDKELTELRTLPLKNPL